MYPIGNIIESTNANFNPNELYIGTTWEKIEGRFTLGSSADYALGSTGGEATHTLTADEMPSHRHIYTSKEYSLGSSGTHIQSCLTNGPVGNLTTYTGGDKQHNNMPPYIVVNKWVRIA